jgi:hypothetical protein
MEAIFSSEMSAHIRTTQRYISEDGNIHNYRCENFKSYKGSAKHKQKNGAVLRVDKTVFLTLH